MIPVPVDPQGHPFNPGGGQTFFTVRRSPKVSVLTHLDNYC